MIVPGDLVRPKHNRIAGVWETIEVDKAARSNDGEPRYCMKDNSEGFKGLALVIACPGYMGAGSTSPEDSAVMLFVSRIAKFRWVWAEDLKVV